MVDTITWSQRGIHALSKNTPTLPFLLVTIILYTRFFFYFPFLLFFVPHHLSILSYSSMSRYGYKAQLDPRVSVYQDDDGDFSRGSFGAKSRAVSVKEPSVTSHPSSLPPSHPARDSRPFTPAPVSGDHDRPFDLAYRYNEQENEHQDPPYPETPSAPIPASSYIAWTGGVVQVARTPCARVFADKQVF